MGGLEGERGEEDGEGMEQDKNVWYVQNSDHEGQTLGLRVEA